MGLILKLSYPFKRNKFNLRIIGRLKGSNKHLYSSFKGNVKTLKIAFGL